MEAVILDILAELRRIGAQDDGVRLKVVGAQDSDARLEVVGAQDDGSHSGAAAALDDKALAKIIHKHNRNVKDNRRHIAKKKLLPYYLKVKETNPILWQSWGVNADLEEALIRLLRVKPRRTSSGVATITVITKPWKCSSSCLYCPNDLRMPKSYLSDEPACQRAERNYFDPYLQVASRLRALTHMGHVTDKIELIVLGGTWSDYPEPYQIWFVKELFKALNDDATDTEAICKQRRKFYKAAGISNTEDELNAEVEVLQQQISNGQAIYNTAMTQLYERRESWRQAAQMQSATMQELYEQHIVNEKAKHRVVGLVVETRPDRINAVSLTQLRALGCTKVQVGIQSVDAHILRKNNRGISPRQIADAFNLLRIFGFKIHAHFMLNLYGANLDLDRSDYQKFVSDVAYKPDEIKLYPCSLVLGTQLCEHYADGTWQPYDEQELINLLVDDVLATPSYMRISRMIRDISAKDIVAGNKKTNLRQMVEAKLKSRAEQVQEIRFREITTDDAITSDLKLDVQSYDTELTIEHFLQWITPAGKIAGFLRLSLPKRPSTDEAGKSEKCCNPWREASLPIAPDEAMIREVHIYGKVAGLSGEQTNAQHLGLGRQLIARAEAIAEAQGYSKMNVISSVGTRNYYLSLGFANNGLYQQKRLNATVDSRE